MSALNATEHSIEAARIGDFIHQLREAQGFTQYRLAQLVGVHRTSIRDIENGKSIPRIHVAVKLAEALDIEYSDFAELLGFDEAKMLPEPATYFRTKYALTDKQAAELDTQIKRLAKKHHINLEDNPEANADTT